MDFPQPQPGDNEDVAWALQTAHTMWERGDQPEAIKWLQRAADAAEEAGDDMRLLSLARAAAELNAAKKAENGAAAAAPAPATSTPPPVPRGTTANGLGAAGPTASVAPPPPRPHQRTNLGLGTAGPTAAAAGAASATATPVATPQPPAALTADAPLASGWSEPAPPPAGATPAPQIPAQPAVPAAQVDPSVSRPPPVPRQGPPPKPRQHATATPVVSLPPPIPVQAAPQQPAPQPQASPQHSAPAYEPPAQPQHPPQQTGYGSRAPGMRGRGGLGAGAFVSSAIATPQPRAHVPTASQVHSQAVTHAFGAPPPREAPPAREAPLARPAQPLTPLVNRGEKLAAYPTLRVAVNRSPTQRGTLIVRALSDGEAAPPGSREALLVPLTPDDLLE